MLTAEGRLEAEDRSLATISDDLLRRDLARARQRCLQRAECEADTDTGSQADGDPYTCLDNLTSPFLLYLCPHLFHQCKSSYNHVFSCDESTEFLPMLRGCED